MKKNLLAVFVLGFATLLLAGCMTTNEEVTTDETVAEQDVVIWAEVVEADAQEVVEEAKEEVKDETVAEEAKEEATEEVAEEVAEEVVE